MSNVLDSRPSDLTARWGTGVDVEITVTVTDADGAPLEGVTPAIYLGGPANAVEPLDDAEADFTGTGGTDGVWTIAVPGQDSGSHRLRVTLDDEVVAVGFAEVGALGSRAPTTALTIAGGSVTLALSVAAVVNTGGGGTAEIAVEDDGVEIVDAVATINFTGAGVTVTDEGGGVVDVAIPGGSGGGPVAWGDVTDKPTEFPPEDHTHAPADILGTIGTPIDLTADAGPSVAVDLSGIDDDVVSQAVLLAATVTDITVTMPTAVADRELTFVAFAPAATFDATLTGSGQPIATAAFEILSRDLKVVDVGFGPQWTAGDYGFDNEPGGGLPDWGDIGGTLSDQTDLQSALDGKADTSHAHAASDVTSGSFDPARLATGTPAAGKYPDGTGAWTDLPSAGAVEWGDITGSIGDQADLQDAIAEAGAHGIHVPLPSAVGPHLALTSNIDVARGTTYWIPMPVFTDDVEITHLWVDVTGGVASCTATAAVVLPTAAGWPGVAQASTSVGAISMASAAMTGAALSASYVLPAGSAWYMALLALGGASHPASRGVSSSSVWPTVWPGTSAPVTPTSSTGRILSYRLSGQTSIVNTPSLSASDGYTLSHVVYASVEAP